MNIVDEKLILTIEDNAIPVRRNESGRKYSTFKSGGFVGYVICPTTRIQLETSLDLLKGYKYHLIGNGSNVLISDNGVNCILTTRFLKGYVIEGDTVNALSGESVHLLAIETANSRLSGLEFCVGIPASVGGAVYMNAGAHGREIKDALVSATVYRNGEIRDYAPEELRMRYRSSSIGNGVVVSARFDLTAKSVEECRKTIDDYIEYRRNTQPSQASVGSVYKSVNGKSAWQYIQGAGLKGVRIGNASFSGKHCNFIVNEGGATTRDYLRLTDLGITTVYDRYGVRLEPEIKLIKD